MADGNPHPPYSPEKRDTDCHTSVATLARNDGGKLHIDSKKGCRSSPSY